mgnify:CR=1 FL=1
MNLRQQIHIPIATATAIITALGAAAAVRWPDQADVIGLVTPIAVGAVAVFLAQTPAQYDQALKALAYDAEQAASKAAAGTQLEPVAQAVAAVTPPPAPAPTPPVDPAIPGPGTIAGA